MAGHNPVSLPNIAGEPDASRRELLYRVFDTIKPYFKGYEEPKHSVEQLAVIAVLFKAGKSWKEAFYWTLETFPYWNDESVDFIAYGSDGEDLHNIEKFRLDFQRAFKSLEVPITRIGGRPVHESDSFDTDGWAVETTAARVFLGLCNIPPIPASRFPSLSKAAKNAKQFRFLDLPAELREKIYAYTLDLPSSGVALETRPQRTDSARGPRLIARTRELNSTIEAADWFPEEFDPTLSMQARISSAKAFIEGPHLAEHLALSLINRQISEEALAYFYKNTHFVFRTFEDLQTFLDKTPRDRRDMIRHVSFILHPREHRTHTKQCARVLPTMRILTGMKGLRELDIWMWKDAFDEVWSKGGRGKKWKDLAKFPGVVALRAMRGLQKVTVHGDCNEVKAILEKEMILEKEAKKKRASKKRAADEEGEDEEGPRATKKAA